MSDMVQPGGVSRRNFIKGVIASGAVASAAGYSTGSTIASQLGRFRPFPELRGHRMVLDNVYNCSADLHSGSGIGRGSSYNCFAAIAADLGLEAPETRPARAARPQAARR